MNLIIIFVFVMAILTGGLGIVLVKYRNLQLQIKKVTSGIRCFNENEKGNNIVLFTDEQMVKDLLVEVNKLLEGRQDLKIKQVKQEESNRRMISNISHDLKTPLTVILGYAELIQHDMTELPADTRSRIEKIQEKTKEVLAIIQTFFDVMKIEAGDFTMVKEEIDLSELCREEIINYYAILESAGFAVKIEIPETKVTIIGDPLSFKRILSNLLQNSIRYGADGKYLKLKLYEKDQTAFVEVIDRGKGIVEDQQDKVFERLFTLEDSRNKKYQGSGLGLTITKRLAESMQGTISLESTPYQETRFCVAFPLAKKNS